MIKAILKTLRPPFLVLTLTSLLLVIGWAEYQQVEWHGAIFFLICVGALAAHMSVNMLNEYEDYHSGLDDLTERTPFSGGSGSLQQTPEAEEWVGMIGYALIGLVMVIGLFFIYMHGWKMLALGGLGILIILSYTRWITKHPWLCLVVAGLAFGPLMIGGGYFALTGQWDNRLLLVSLVPFFLVNNLLLLNQIPDEAADQKIGRFNFLHLVGIQHTLTVYKMNGILTFVLLFGLILIGWLPVTSLLVIISLFVFILLWLALKYEDGQIKALDKALGLSVSITLLTPALLSVGLMLGNT